MTLQQNPYDVFLPDHRRELTYNPGNIVHHRCDLFNDKNGSDKVYILQIEEINTDNYAVVAYYGKRASNLTSKMYESSLSYSGAGTHLNKRRNKKISDGYEGYNEGAILNQGTPKAKRRKNANNVAGVLVDRFLKLQPERRYPKMSALNTPKTFINYCTKQDSILLELPSREFFYMYFELPGSWLIRPQDHNSNRHDESIDIIHPAYRSEKDADTAQQIGPAVFIGVYGDHGERRVFDLVAFKGLEVEKFPWTTRRGMMNAIYATVYPAVDPYDDSLEVPFQEYFYDDRKDKLDEYFGSQRDSVLYSTAITNNLFNHKVGIHRFPTSKL